LDVVIILVFISLMLVIAALLLLVSRIRGGDIEHGDRLSLLPLEEDGPGTEAGKRIEKEAGSRHANRKR